MKDILLQGVITATSKKQSEEFPTDDPRKSIYLELDDENTKKAKDFGLREYEGKDGGKFFIVKASKTITVYDAYGRKTYVDGRANEESNNFESDGKVRVSIVKGNSRGNDFYRIHAVMGVIKEIEPQNPFADFIKADASDLDI